MNDSLKKVLLLFLYIGFIGMIFLGGKSGMARLTALFQIGNISNLDERNLATYVNKEQGWSFFYPKNLIIVTNSQTAMIQVVLKDEKDKPIIIVERHDPEKSKLTGCSTFTNSLEEIPTWLSLCTAGDRVLTKVNKFKLGEEEAIQLLGPSLINDNLEAYAVIRDEIIYVVFPLAVKKDIYASDETKKQAREILESIY